MRDQLMLLAAGVFFIFLSIVSFGKHIALEGIYRICSVSFMQGIVSAPSGEWGIVFAAMIVFGIAAWSAYRSVPFALLLFLSVPAFMFSLVSYHVWALLIVMLASVTVRWAPTISIVSASVLTFVLYGPLGALFAFAGLFPLSLREMRSRSVWVVRYEIIGLMGAMIIAFMARRDLVVSGVMDPLSFERINALFSFNNPFHGIPILLVVLIAFGVSQSLQRSRKDRWVGIGAVILLVLLVLFAEHMIVFALPLIFSLVIYSLSKVYERRWRVGSAKEVFIAVLIVGSLITIMQSSGSIMDDPYVLYDDGPTVSFAQDAPFYACAYGPLLDDPAYAQMSEVLESSNPSDYSVFFERGIVRIKASEDMRSDAGIMIVSRLDAGVSHMGGSIFKLSYASSEWYS